MAITRPWGIKVYGPPAPKGSMKCIGGRGKVKHQLVNDNPATTVWQTAVETAARLHIPERADKGQPLEVEITFTFDRPANHYGTGRNARTLRPDAPPRPSATSNGDGDKLERAVWDALQAAGVLHNDAQVVEQSARKYYAGTAWPDVLDRPGAVIRIQPVGPLPLHSVGANTDPGETHHDG